MMTPAAIIETPPHFTIVMGSSRKIQPPIAPTVGTSAAAAAATEEPNARIELGAAIQYKLLNYYKNL